MPVPADMRCSSPGRMTALVPVLSACSSAPSSTQDRISMSACGWLPKPWPGATRSSLMTSSGPTPAKRGSR